MRHKFIPSLRPGWTALPLALLMACASPAQKSPEEPPGGDSEGESARASPTASRTGEDVEPLAQMATDLRELLVELISARACRRIEGSLMALSGAGATGGGAVEPAVGVLWIDECSATPVDPTHLRLELSGAGWRWLSREKSRAGATFKIDQYVRFSVDVSMVATADLAYDPDGHIVTAWLLPTEQVQADVRPLGDIEVNTDSLWADIVGGAASLIGKAPGERAEEKLVTRGGRRFERRIGQGFSVAANLCTGRTVTHLGTLPQGKMPEIPLDPKGQLQRASGRARLQDGGLLMFGPFAGGTALTSAIALESDGAVRAELVCEAEAREMYRAYLGGRSLPDVEILEGDVFRERSRQEMQWSGAPGCPAVLVLRPAGGAPVELRWAVYEPGRGFEPIVECR